MSWFNKPDNWKVDPDKRQDKASDACNTRPMTSEEWEKYGPKNDKTKGNLMFKQSDIQRSLEHRGLRKGEKVGFKQDNQSIKASRPYDMLSTGELHNREFS